MRGVAYAMPLIFLSNEDKNMNIIPTLNSKGHAKTPEEKLDAVLLYYQSLNPSMTNRYRGKIRSLQNAIWESGTDSGNIERLISIVKNDLTSILTNNFPEGVTTEVTSEAISADGSTYNLIISATVIENGKTYDMAGSLDKIDSRFMDVFNVTRVNTV